MHEIHDFTSPAHGLEGPAFDLNSEECAFDFQDSYCTMRNLVL